MKLFQCKRLALSQVRQVKCSFYNKKQYYKKLKHKRGQNMKKTLSTAIALALSLGITGTALASDSFSDVPKDHWSYSAIDQLAKDGIITGYGDGTFAGDRLMSRYEMASVVAKAMDHLKNANPADQALVEKLEREYVGELDTLNKRVTTNENDIKDLKSRVDNVMLSGFVRAKYDHDDMDSSSTFGQNDNNKHFYMDFEGKMKVADQWDAHFQSETRKGYTTNQSWRNSDYAINQNNGSVVKEERDNSDDQSGTFQRIWVEGKAGAVGVTMGTKWWGYGFQNVIMGHAADGAQLDYNLTPDWKASIFNLRPRQGGLVTLTDGNGGSSTTLYGGQLMGKLGHNLDAAFVYGGNGNKENVEGGISRWGEVDLRTQAAKNVKLTATYARTNADNNNTSQEYRVDYKGTDLKHVGSFGSYARFMKFDKYGDVSHDDEWSSLPSNMKGWILGVTYVPYQNVQWETFYSKQKQVEGDKDRKLIRTQIDFHF